MGNKSGKESGPESSPGLNVSIQHSKSNRKVKQFKQSENESKIGMLIILEVKIYD